MTDIVEGALRFRFPDDWHVAKYDDPKGFAGRTCKIDGTKKIDILALSPDRLLMIEVKDFRHHAIETKHRKSLTGSDPLHQEVAQKVRDTFSFLVAAHRSGDESLRPYCRHALGSRKRDIDVILLIEEDERRARSIRGGGGGGRNDLQNGIQALLKPFGVRCQVQRR